MLKVLSLLLLFLSACATGSKYPRETRYSKELLTYRNIEPVCTATEEKFAALEITKKKNSYPYLKYSKDLPKFKEILEQYPKMDERFFVIKKAYYKDIKASPVKLIDYNELLDKPCGLITHYRLIRSFLETHMQYEIKTSDKDRELILSSLRNLMDNSQTILGTMMVVGVLSTDYYSEILNISDDDVLKMKILKKQIAFDANEFTERFKTALEKFPVVDSDGDQSEKITREQEIAKYDSVSQEMIDLVDKIYKDEYASAQVYREQIIDVLK